VTPSIVWFRQDLRLQDNPALEQAIRRGGPVVPVYIWDQAGEGKWSAGAASSWWLHHALAALEVSLRERGSRLLFLSGDSQASLHSLVRRTGASAVYWNRRYEPAAVARDGKIKASLVGEGIEVETSNASLLFEPDAVRNKQGGPFKVFTPYWRHCLELAVAPPVRPSRGLIAPLRAWPKSPSLDKLGLLPRIGWDSGLAGTWTPGEKGAARRLDHFVSQALEDYGSDRDLPALDGTSMLSPWLHWGEVGPRQVWSAVRSLSKDSGIFPANNGARIFLAEVGWREFAHHLLFHFPQTPAKPLRPEFGRFPWARDPGGVHLRAWQTGTTGYPIVDAGMRQLWHTGWMHNRVRMVTASFLVKHLRLPWGEGASWFWNTLVDADLANNTLGWQWSAGCGADAAPFFRIFAPVLQGERFDPEGNYVRRWVPELARVPAEFIHSPWTAPPAVLGAAGVVLGTSYPKPIVEHSSARLAALAAFKKMRVSGAA
jgi:deoxyribodipyrimidine photo-lyase